MLIVEVKNKVEKIRLNIDNERYYSEAFIKGWETGVEVQFKADVREQRPKGEWVNTAPSDRSDNIICDQCGYNSIARYDYCPNCGSRMCREDGEA